MYVDFFHPASTHVDNGDAMFSVYLDLFHCASAHITNGHAESHLKTYISFILPVHMLLKYTL